VTGVSLSDRLGDARTSKHDRVLKEIQFLEPFADTYDVSFHVAASITQLRVQNSI
jgi:hypothetical protein